MKDYSLITGSVNSLIDGDILWMMAYNTSTLLKIDLNKKILVDAFPIFEKCTVKSGYRNIEKVDDKLYIFPLDAEGIYVFDLINEKFMRIDVKDKINVITISAKDENFIFFSDLYGQKMYRLDTKNNHIEEKTIEKEDGTSFFVDQNLRFMSFYRKEDKVYIPVYSDNIVFVINIKKLSYEVIQLKKALRLRTITKKGDEFLLSTLDDEIVRWNPQLNEIVSTENLNILSGNHKAYWNIFSYDMGLLFVPEFERKLTIKSEEKYYELDFDYSLQNALPEKYGFQFISYFEYKGIPYVQAMSNGQIYCVDINKKQVINVDIVIPEIIRKKVAECVLDTDTDILSESSIINANDFFTMISEK